ncbi:MAG TPA: hypothetical protein VFK01_12570 [Bradyrhizobium sp.]|nr:hypothetical protein [Bradyrhizobium sp.]
MGFLTDIRSGKRGRFGLGAYAVIFWSIVGLGVGSGLSAWVGAGVEKGFLLFASIGLMIGLSVGFYAGFGATRTARALALPGVLLAMIEIFVG